MNGRTVPPHHGTEGVTVLMNGQTFPPHHGTEGVMVLKNGQTFPPHGTEGVTVLKNGQTFPPHGTEGVMVLTNGQTFPGRRGSKGAHATNERLGLSRVLWVHRGQWCFMNVQTITCVFITKGR